MYNYYQIILYSIIFVEKLYYFIKSPKLLGFYNLKQNPNQPLNFGLVGFDTLIQAIGEKKVRSPAGPRSHYIRVQVLFAGIKISTS